jgi:hypothetical protein
MGWRFIEIVEFDYFRFEFFVRFFIILSTWNFLISHNNNIYRNKKKWTLYWILKINRYSGIETEGAAKLVEIVAELLNLTTLNLNFA